jgi:hypothetical protein
VRTEQTQRHLSGKKRVNFDNQTKDRNKKKKRIIPKMSVSAIKNLEVEMVKQQKEIGDFQKECMDLMNRMGKNFERIESVIEEQQHVFKGHYTASDATCQKLATLCEFLTISLNEQVDKNELRD